MTIGGALSELNNLLKADDIPIYYKPSIKAVIDTITLEQEPKWIPVSEGLPEAYGEYLITWTTSQSKRPFIAICEAEETSVFDHENYRFNVEWLLEDYIKAYPDVEVIAWMPLPEPYKADKAVEE